MSVAAGSTPAARAALVAGAALMVLVAWMEAGGRAAGAIWLDALAHLLAMVVVLAWLASSAGRCRPPGGAAWWPAGVLLVLSALRAAYPYAAWITLLELGIGLGVAGALAVLLAADAPRLLLARVWVAALLPAAAAALLQVLSGAGRGRAGFVNPNHLGALLAAGVPLALAVRPGPPGEGSRVWWQRAAAWSPVALLAAGLLATASRGALLALLAVGVFHVTRARGTAGRRRLAAAAALLILALAGGGSLWWRFAGGGDIYRYDRLRIWPQALAMAAEAPWLGIGPGQFRHAAPAYNFPRDDAPVRYGRSFRTPHSQLLLLLVETGVLGLLALGLALASTALAARAGWRRRGTPAGGARRLARAAAASLAVLGVVCLVDEPLARPPVLLAAALLAALALPPPRRRAVPPAPLSRLSAGTVVAALALGLVLLPAAAQSQALAGVRAPSPVQRAALLRRASALNPYQPFPAGEGAALLLAHAARPLDVISYGRIRTRLDAALARAPEETSFLLTGARLERRACVELFRAAPTCERATEAYRLAAAASPRDPRILLEAAGFASLLGRDPTAAALLEQAVALEPGFVRAWAALARLREAGVPGDPAAARAGLAAARERAAGVVPDSGYARDILAHVAPPGAPGGGGGGR